MFSLEMRKLDLPPPAPPSCFENTGNAKYQSYTAAITNYALNVWYFRHIMKLGSGNQFRKTTKKNPCEFRFSCVKVSKALIFFIFQYLRFILKKIKLQFKRIQTHLAPEIPKKKKWLKSGTLKFHHNASHYHFEKHTVLKLNPVSTIRCLKKKRRKK